MSRLFVVIAALAVIPANAAQREFSQAGKMRIDTGAERSATLHLMCTPDTDGGAVSIELIVPEAYPRKDFDYDDFEGPDAAAGDKALSTLTWTTAAGKTTITHAAAGWYAPEPPDSFMFGVSQLSHRREEPARLLNAIGAEGGQFTWQQAAFDKSKRQLVAHFDLDAAAAQRLHTAVAECLPQNMPMHK
jgi:hypothetical protein